MIHFTEETLVIIENYLNGDVPAAESQHLMLDYGATWLTDETERRQAYRGLMVGLRQHGEAILDLGDDDWDAVRGEVVRCPLR